MADYTTTATLTELYLAHYCRGLRWTPTEQHARDQYAAGIPPDTLLGLQQQAHTMGAAVLEYLHHPPIKDVYWCGQEHPEDPADVKLTLQDGTKWGLSIKTTKTTGNLCLKNPGLGTIALALLDPVLSVLAKRTREEVIKLYQLSPSDTHRKQQLRADDQLQARVRKWSDALLVRLRNRLLSQLRALSDPDLRQHLLEHWIHGSTTIPPYLIVRASGDEVQVTEGHGNPLITAVLHDPLTLEPAGSCSINVKRHADTLLTLRVKWCSEPLCSPIKFTAEASL